MHKNRRHSSAQVMLKTDTFFEKRPPQNAHTHRHIFMQLFFILSTPTTLPQDEIFTTLNSFLCFCYSCIPSLPLCLNIYIQISLEVWGRGMYLKTGNCLFGRLSGLEVWWK